MGFITLLTGCGVILVIAGIWFAVYYRLNPGTETASGKARVTGTCGDTMEIGLCFQDDRVITSTHWTDGCVYSLNCVSVAADLAIGKTPEAILDLDAKTIATAVGGLPRDHFHCASLAAETLHGAVDDYMKTPRGDT